jgi:hypothetical protein
MAAYLHLGVDGLAVDQSFDVAIDGSQGAHALRRLLLLLLLMMGGHGAAQTDTDRSEEEAGKKNRQIGGVCRR